MFSPYVHLLYNALLALFIIRPQHEDGHIFLVGLAPIYGVFCRVLGYKWAQACILAVWKSLIPILEDLAAELQNWQLATWYLKYLGPGTLFY